MKESVLPAASYGARGAPAPARVLVVEDERIVALDLVTTLRRFGYIVEGPVDTGERAIAAALGSRPDLVLMDIRLRGEMDGIAAAARIAEAVDAPIVFLTAHSDGETLERAKAAGPYSYLVKPFRQDDLRCAIEVALHRHKLVAQLREREREVQLLNANLERRVIERTAELEAANRELEAFSYSVAHDLRTPLRGIDGFTQLVLDQHARDLGPDGRSHLQRVRKAAQLMSKLIDDLLDLARVVRSECVRHRVHLTELAQEIDAELRSTHPDRRVQFDNQPQMIARGDPMLLRVLLHNLLSNAWKFTRPAAHARIEFGSRAHDGEILYYVRDNGVGFDMKDAEHLFGVFRRLHHSADFPGNGIGLAIVERAVQRHSGRVWADAAPGAGATFWFTLEERHERSPSRTH